MSSSPGSPRSRFATPATLVTVSSEAGSTIRYTTPGSGSPISGSDHARASQRHRLEQIVASVGPYTFTTRTRSAQRRTASGGQTSPPMTTTRNDEGRRDGSIAGSNEGGRSAWVMRRSASTSRRPRAARVVAGSAMTSVAPEQSAVVMSEIDASKLVERWKRTRAPGARSKAAICARTSVGRPRCATRTPLGAPVLPLVKTTYAGDSGAALASARSRARDAGAGRISGPGGYGDAVRTPPRGGAPAAPPSGNVTCFVGDPGARIAVGPRGTSGATRMRRGFASCVRARRRSGGSAGSSGKKAAPASHTPSKAARYAADFSIASATRSPGPTPSSRNMEATAQACAKSEAYVMGGASRSSTATRSACADALARRSKTIVAAS